MWRKIIFLLVVFSTVSVFGQGSSAPSAQSDKNQKKSDLDSTLGTVTSSGLNQNVVSASDLSNNELLARSRTIYVSSDSVFVKKADLEKYLLRQKELEEFRLHVVQNKQDADLLLNVKRIAFTNNFPYSITDRVSSIVIMQGEINAFPSKVPAQIAAALAEKLRQANSKPKQESQQSPPK